MELPTDSIPHRTEVELFCMENNRVFNDEARKIIAKLIREACTATPSKTSIVVPNLTTQIIAELETKLFAVTCLAERTRDGGDLYRISWLSTRVV